MSFRSFNRRDLLKVGAFGGAAALLNLGIADRQVFAEEFSSSPSAPAVIKLSGNENPYGPSPKAKQAIVEALSLGNRYAQTEAAQLEKMIAERESVAPESVVLGTGSGEILAMAAVAYGLNQGEIVTAAPSFPALVQYGERIGAKIVRVPLDAALAHDLDAMNRATTSATKLVYICNPNNPTGTIVATEKLKQFCADVSRRAPVLVDEAYLEYTEDFPASSMIDFVRKGADVIVLRTFSKIYGLAGMRVGYGLAKPEIAARLRRFRMTWFNPVSLHAAISSLEDRDFVRESRRRNAATREFMRREFEKLNMPQTPSHCNSIWVNVGAGNRDLPARLAKYNIQIRGAGNAPLDSDWARITVGTQEEMQFFFKALRETLATGAKV